MPVASALPLGCPETGGDEPFSAKCPLSTEGDAEIEHGGVSACGSFVVVHFRSYTLNGTPTEMTASLGSSRHVFFSPRVQLNIHVAQTSMCLLDFGVTSVGCAMPRWRSTGRFQSNAGELCECACTRSQNGFHSAVGDLVLTCFVAPCRYHLLAQATQVSTTHHSRVLTCFERVDGSRNRIEWFGGEDRRLAFDTVREQLLAWPHTARTTAKWCLLIAAGSTSRVTRPTSNSLRRSFGMGPVIWERLCWSDISCPFSRTEQDHGFQVKRNCQALACCSIACGLSHVLGCMN